jgi:hypothetical protein
MEIDFIKFRKIDIFILFLLILIGARGETNNHEGIFYSSDKVYSQSTNTVCNVSNRLDEIKQPVKWMQWGFDFRFRHEYHNNAYTLDSQSRDHEYNYQRYRARLQFSILPVDLISLNFRLAWEGREYFKPDSKSGMDWDEGMFDLFNVGIGDLTNHNILLTIGRQEIQFGDQWLIFDPTTTDGSRSEFLDAARLTLKLPNEKTLLNLIYFDMAADSERWLPVINSSNKPLSEQDSRGAIIYLEKIPYKNHNFDAYFIYKHDHKVISKGNDGDRYVFGSRADGMLFNKHWHYTLEFAPQFGTKNGHDLLAFGLNSKIEYLFNDPLKNKLTLGFEYLSGDDPNTDTIEAWDPIWGRRARWSELLIFTFGAENNGRNGEWTNLKRIELGWGFSPTKKIEFSTRYMPLFADENTYRNTPGYSNDGDFRGHFLANVLKFKITKNLDGHLWAEFFFPGDYYSPERRDLATFFRTQLMYQF